MGKTECRIEHDPDGGYYTLTVNGKFEGNYDTMREAAQEYELIIEEARGEENHE